MKLRVWHIPQVPMSEPFYVTVENVAQAKLVLNTLWDYDLFQYERRIKPDYANASGLEEFDGEKWREWWSDDGRNISEVMQEERAAE